MTRRNSAFALGQSLVLSGVFLLSAAVPAVSAQQSRPLSAADREKALSAVRGILSTDYVIVEMRPSLVERLSRSEKAGRYGRLDPFELAERVSDDLRDVSHDGHLSLRYAPADYAAAIAPPSGDRGTMAVARRDAARDHHGLTELRLLPGNIRYLRITGFEWESDQTGAAYDDAMRFLREGDAVVIDLRGNGGGSAQAVQYLVSHFLPADTLLLTFIEGSQTPVQSRTLSHLPAGRLVGKPLYVLIDGGVASAAEEFAYHVQEFRLGELVGTKTAGGANNNRLVPIEPGFILSVSVGKPVHAVSGTNWEGTGIAPSVETPAPRALEVAQSMALTRLSRAPGTAPELRAEYQWALTAVEASLRPVALPQTQLQRLSGPYGEATVQLRDGALWLSRPNRETIRLTPLTEDGLFGLEGIDGLRVRFYTDRLELLRLGAPEPRVFRKGPP